MNGSEGNPSKFSSRWTALANWTVASWTVARVKCKSKRCVSIVVSRKCHLNICVWNWHNSLTTGQHSYFKMNAKSSKKLFYSIKKDVNHSYFWDTYDFDEGARWKFIKMSSLSNSLMGAKISICCWVNFHVKVQPLLFSTPTNKEK